MLIDDLIDAARIRAGALVLRPDVDSDGFVAEIGAIKGVASTPAGAMRALRSELDAIAAADLTELERQFSTGNVAGQTHRRDVA